MRGLFPHILWHFFEQSLPKAVVKPRFPLGVHALHNLHKNKSEKYKILLYKFKKSCFNSIVIEKTIAL